ncbi:hypothetical protein HDU97_001962 [Phlyctochytrium planicorne]|nr:hypothetical protein HDU97_001962 [Phlyctochytrium planicorne]
MQQDGMGMRTAPVTPEMAFLTVHSPSTQLGTPSVTPDLPVFTLPTASNFLGNLAMFGREGFGKECDLDGASDCKSEHNDDADHSTSISSPQSQNLIGVNATSTSTSTTCTNQLPPVNLSKNSVSRTVSCHRCTTLLGILISYPSELSVDPEDLLDAIDVFCIDCANAGSARSTPILTAITSLSTESPMGSPLMPMAKSPSLDSLEAEPDLSMRKRRNKGVGKNMHLYCEACNRKMGFGGVCRSIGNINLSSVQRVSVEPICRDCVENFDLCTRCGGGGTWRSGKWRPRQLFHDERRTCSLSHDRLGSITRFQITTYKCPPAGYLIENKLGEIVNANFDCQPIVSKRDDEIDAYVVLRRAAQGDRSVVDVRAARSNKSTNPMIASSVNAVLSTGSDVMRKRRDQFNTMNRIRLLGNWATPAFMASYPDLLGDWGKLTKYSNSWLDDVNDMMVGSMENIDDTDVVRYLVAADSLRTLKPTTTASTTPKRKRVDPKAADSTRLNDLVLLGYFFFEWDIRRQCLHLRHLYYDGKDSVREQQEDSPLNFMFSSMVDRVRYDLRFGIFDVNTFKSHPTSNLSTPEHVWASVPKAALAERNRVVQHMEKLGFLPLTQYADKNGYDLEILDRLFVHRCQNLGRDDDVEEIRNWKRGRVNELGRRSSRSSARLDSTAACSCKELMTTFAIRWVDLAEKFNCNK